MKKIPVEDAVGQILCHDMTAILENGFKGVKFKRGHIIIKEDIPSLLNIGKSHIYIWNPGADEIHEDDAGLAITQAICGENLTFSGPQEGKYQISALIKGLFCVNGQALKQINSIDDYTIACRPNHTAVSDGESVAGARIVPLVTMRNNVTKAVKIARENSPVFELKPFIPLKTGIIITGSEIYYGRIKDQFEPIMRKKLDFYGADILGVRKCPDDLEHLSTAINYYKQQGAQLILLTGGMSVDPDDLTPTAIKNSGASMITQGVPMQPGNMLTMAYLEDSLLIGVPGASMHSKFTSLDIFLPRIFAGEKISHDDIAGLGEGGFCMKCQVCHYPICYFGRK